MEEKPKRQRAEKKVKKYAIAQFGIDVDLLLARRGDELIEHVFRENLNVGHHFSGDCRLARDFGRSMLSP